MKNDLSLDEIVRYLAERNARGTASLSAAQSARQDNGFKPMPAIIGWGVPLLAMTGLAMGMLGAFGVHIPGLP